MGPAGLGSGGAPGARFASLDGIRGLAAVAVLTTHVGFYTGDSLSGLGHTVLARLDLGVAVFFVLSGFLLHRPQTVAALSGRALPAPVPYLWRRALRVLPAYWLAVAAALLLLRDNEGATAADWLRQLTLTAVAIPEGPKAGLTQMWSLSTEVGFYLLLPLLGRLAGRSVRRQLLVCAGMIVVAWCWQGLVGSGALPPHTGTWLPGHTDWFALGMGLAVLSAARVRLLDELGAAWASCWLAAGALFVVAGTPVAGPYGLTLLTGPQGVARSVLYGAIAALLVLPAVVDAPAPAVGRLLASPPARWLGQVSYGVFLLHLVVLSLVGTALGYSPFTGHFLALYAWTLGVSLLLGWASLQAVERPALRLRTWRPGRQPGPDRVGTG